MRCILILVNFGENENWMKFTSSEVNSSEVEIVHLCILNAAYSIGHEILTSYIYKFNKIQIHHIKKNNFGNPRHNTAKIQSKTKQNKRQQQPP